MLQEVGPEHTAGPPDRTGLPHRAAYSYRLYDRCIGSEFPLAGIQPRGPGRPDFYVEMGKRRDPLEQGFDWIHEWKSDPATTAIACARRGSEYLLRFPLLADFHVQPAAARIEVRPFANSARATTTHLLIDQVIPRLLSHLGKPVFHASTVVLPDERVVAFVGPSGCGKSTLAAAMLRAGCRPAADDSFLLEQKGGRPEAVPAYASLRLWEDSLNALNEPGATGHGKAEPIAHYTSKKQLFLEPVRQARFELAGLFLLAGPASEPAPDGVEVRPAGGIETAMAMLHALFELDPASPGAQKRNFSMAMTVASDLAARNVPVYFLSYPHQYDRLPAVSRAVFEYMGSGQPTSPQLSVNVKYC